MRTLFALSLLLFSGLAPAATTTIPTGSTQAQIQSALTSAGAVANSTVAFAAGVYQITGTLTVPCTSNLTVTGPVATPATAILNPSFTNQPIFNLTDCTGVTVEYLNFTKTQSIKFNLDAGTWCANGCQILHNQFTALTAQLPTGVGGNAGPACDSGTGTQGNCDSPGDTAITFASNSGAACPACSFLTNTTILYNQFGDAASCLTPADVMNGSTYDYGGNCSGIQFYTAINGVTLEFNNFVHLEEGYHVMCGPVGGTDCGGSTAWTFKNFIADYNDFSGIHRFAAEMQLQGSLNVHVDHNSYHSPYSPWAWSFGISNACCAGLNGSTATAPGVTNIDDVIIAESAPVAGAYIGMADEAWGTGAQYTGDLIQGNWGNGFEWAYITGGSISNDIVCGAQMAAAGTLIHQETTPPNGTAPIQTGNVTGATCAAVPSVAPTVTLAGSTFTLAATGNTGIWYTTDGTTPAPGQGTAQLYVAPFTVPGTTTVKAVGMWGAPNQPKSYAAGYGYVPSAVVSATYTAAPVLVSAIMQSSPSANLNTIQMPGSLQLSILGTYSDGSKAVVPNSSVAWLSANPKVFSVSSTGLVTGVGAGQANVTAQIGAIPSSQWTVTVTAPIPVVITLPAGTYTAGTYTIVVPAGGISFTLVQ